MPEVTLVEPAHLKHLISVHVDPDLYRDISADAARLGVSIAAASRMRLRTGKVPQLSEPKKGKRK